MNKKNESTIDFIANYDREIGRIAADYKLDTFPCQIEVITSEQMIDIYSAIGMPLGYHHWSFGKQFLDLEQKYLHGYTGLAYEIVINSNPCIAYILADNSNSLQATVIAHACYGHNSFFKNNYLFQEWTRPDSIIDYLLYAKKYIAECEAKYGIDLVEEVLDACHALMHYGVDRYQHTHLSKNQEKLRELRHEQYLQENISEFHDIIPTITKNCSDLPQTNPTEPQENILYFIEKKAPLLDPWKAEIVRIIRKMAQYFYPQRQTKIMNEGWACFWHYRLLNDLYEQKLTTDEIMMEFIQNHTNVLNQPGFDDPHYNGLNPYALGFNIFMDIKRICEQPTEEDKQWFPDIAHSNWLKTLDFAMRSFKDESFIAQYLSPKLIRDMHLFAIVDDDKENELIISAIHNEQGYQKIRKALSEQYNMSLIEPNIQVFNIEENTDRSLTLRHYQQNRMPLQEQEAQEVMKHLYRLWQFPVKLETLDENGNVTLIYKCPS
jgi:spore cortex formation protein SpoVR/YcgB (stage V sporulation)